MTEKELLRAAKSGDANAAEKILAAYEPLAKKAAGGAQLSAMREDALSTAREAIFMAILSFDEGRGVPFAGWAKAKVYGSVRTLFRRECGRRRREIAAGIGSADEGGALSLAADSRDEFFEAEGRAAFSDMTACLAERPRRLLSLMYEQGLTKREASRRLGIDERTAAMMKRRALDKLRKRAEEKI